MDAIPQFCYYSCLGTWVVLVLDRDITASPIEPEDNMQTRVRCSPICGSEVQSLVNMLHCGYSTFCQPPLTQTCSCHEMALPPPSVVQTRKQLNQEEWKEAVQGSVQSCLLGAARCLQCLCSVIRYATGSFCECTGNLNMWCGCAMSHAYSLPNFRSATVGNAG